jgi:hypothetical protein
MPHPAAPIAEPDTGQPSEVWYHWALTMFRRAGGGVGIATADVQAQAVGAQTAATTAQTTAATALSTATGTATALTAETVARTTADTSEATTRALADAAEATTRAAADTAEVTARIAGDTQHGTTAARPVGAITGTRYFDTTLGIPAWWNGTIWVNATGGAV